MPREANPIVLEHEVRFQAAVIQPVCHCAAAHAPPGDNRLRLRRLPDRPGCDIWAARATRTRSRTSQKSVARTKSLPQAFDFSVLQCLQRARHL